MKKMTYFQNKLFNIAVAVESLQIMQTPGANAAFKSVSQTKFQTLSLQLSKYHDLPSLSFVLRYQRQYIGWVLISARPIEKSISMERLSTLQSNLQKINKFAAC